MRCYLRTVLNSTTTIVLFEKLYFRKLEKCQKTGGKEILFLRSKKYDQGSNKPTDIPEQIIKI